MLRYHFLPFIGLLLIIFAGLTSCKTVDIRTNYALASSSESDVDKGRRLLEESYLAMGYDRLAQSTTYSVSSEFNWRMPWTMMPMNALPGNKNKELLFRFSTNTFDGQVTYLEGRKKGKTYGLQSWQGYRTGKDGTTKTKNSARYDWGLPTYHYVIEGPMRLRSAEIVRYAGETEFEGQQYDLVYATWGEDAPHKEHDQWLLYINKDTKMVDLTELTINDFFLPMPKGMKGATVRYEREEAANGSYLPSTVYIQLGEPKAKKKHVYKFRLWDYAFDEFSLTQLHPLPGLEPVGDAKATAKK